MNKVTTYVLAAIISLSTLLLMSNNFALAQDVEVNFGVLKDLDNYTPPPMFDQTNQQSTTSTDFPQIFQNVPIPKRKPAHARARPTKTSYVQPVSRAVPVGEVRTEFISPPIPQARPQTFSVSESYIEEIRKQHNLPPLNKDQKDIIGSSTYVEDTQSGLQIKDADVRDILASIDPDAKLPPKKEKQESSSLASKRVYAEPLPSLNKNIISLPFTKGESKLETEIPAGIIESILRKIAQNPNQRIEIRSYTNQQTNEIQASKRLALTRALEIRDILTDNNINSNIIDVIPVGPSSHKKNSDRVDIVLIDPSLN